MTIGRGIGWIYDHMTRGLDPGMVDQIDAELGDPAARRRVNNARRNGVSHAGVEIG